jgi:ABC-type oligopeptide transport system substrate-binding subunit
MDERFQLSVEGDWLANYPDPSSYLPSFFGCGGGTSTGSIGLPQLGTDNRCMRQLRTFARSAAGNYALSQALT